MRLGDVTASMSAKRQYLCKCGDVFDEEIWHCKCGHHWIVSYVTCRHCKTTNKDKQGSGEWVMTTRDHIARQHEWRDAAEHKFRPGVLRNVTCAA